MDRPRRTFWSCAATTAHVREIVYVASEINLTKGQRPDNPFYMTPSGSIDPPHPSIPANIGEDWTEAQRAIQAWAPNAAARNVAKSTL